MTSLAFLSVPDLVGLAIGVPLGALAVMAWRRRPRPEPARPRILLVLPGGQLAREAIDAAGRLAQAENATVVSTVLLPTPYRFAIDAPRPEAAAAAMDLLETVEQRLQRVRVPVDGRIIASRTIRHGLRRAAEELRFARMVVPAGEHRGGLAAGDVGWLLAHLPGEVLVLRPGDAERSLPKPTPTPRQRAGTSRRSRLSTLPVALRGSSSRKITSRGTL